MELKVPFGCIVSISGSCALLTGFISTFFHKIFIKTRSHVIIHTFKNYFVTVFSIFSFQFLTISNI